jgi:hypothetical protein
MAVLLLTEVFVQIPDPRRAQGKRHPLPGVLALVSVAIMCGCRSLYAIAQWGRDHGPEMAGQLGLKPRHGTPAVSTLHGLFRRLDVEAFEAALRQWAGSWLEPVDELAKAADLEPISIDGKSLCGSRGHELPAVHLLAAYATRLGLVLNQVKADATKEEGGEIIAAPKLLKDLVLQGKVVIGDAIHAQRKLCAQIVRQGGEYLFVVKENQPTLHRELVDLFRSPSAPLFAATTRSTSTAGGWSSGRCGSARS